MKLNTERKLNNNNSYTKDFEAELQLRSILERMPIFKNGQMINVEVRKGFYFGDGFENPFIIYNAGVERQKMGLHSHFFRVTGSIELVDSFENSKHDSEFMNQLILAWSRYFNINGNITHQEYPNGVLGHQFNFEGDWE